VPDATQMLPDLLVEEFVALVRALKQLPKDTPTPIELHWRERLGVAPVWRQRFSTLSFGQRKRACTVAALVGDPWLLVLDEPSNGLDPEAIGLMVELIAERRERGEATVLVSNDSAFVERVGGARYHLLSGRLREHGREHAVALDQASPA
jgi:ABC-type multidrug transport system ATPase subunit